MMVMVERALKAAGTELGHAAPEHLEGFKDAASIAGYAKKSVAGLLEAGLVEGSGNNLNPTGLTSRAEAAVLLYRLYNN
jgi:hypothetical protein